MEDRAFNILNTRKSGVLLPIFSLHSNYGIGSLGKAAYDFIDWLASQGQTYWQVLPVHPTTLENSPYTAFSSMAGNELFIDLDDLVSQNLLRPKDVKNLKPEDPSKIDYEEVRKQRTELFEIVTENFKKNIPADYYSFCDLNQYWLDDYALFMAIKKTHKMAELKDWPDELKFKERDAINEFIGDSGEYIENFKILQFLFHKQWNTMLEYANKQGVYLVGDMPFYVAHDSADVWANPEVFELDENLEPVKVAGCPPDMFSTDGQFWGNPIYNWRYLRRDKYKWWIRRLSKSFELYNVLRIDHFRGFESYYSIDANAESAKFGFWEEGPGYEFFRIMEAIMGEKQIIAEDLGYITADVKQLLNDCGYPGMKVLQFAFDSREEDASYYPYKYPRNSVVYTGNHDNNTILGWIDEVRKADLKLALKYYDLSIEDIDHLPNAMIYSAMGSVANTCILCVQDLLHLGSDARINTPSTVGKNWKWRITSQQLRSLKKCGLKELTAMFGRLAD